MSGENGGDEDSRERMQAMLRGFYDIEDEGGNANDAMDIDAAGFEADRYVESLLKTKSMEELLRQDDRMVKEIRELDSGMRELVYENYNKFISATDTIRAMKDNVEGMESEMDVLLSNMKAISVSSEALNKSLEAKRNNVDKLVGVRRLLQKLEFLFELPSKLGRCIEHKAYAEAVADYTKVSGILARYAHVSSFESIQRESKLMMDGLQVTLMTSVRDEGVRAATLSEYVGLLHTLGAPRRELQEIFLRFHASRLRDGIERVGRARAVKELAGTKADAGADVDANVDADANADVNVAADVAGGEIKGKGGSDSGDGVEEQEREGQREVEGEGEGGDASAGSMAAAPLSMTLVATVRLAHDHVTQPLQLAVDRFDELWIAPAAHALDDARNASRRARGMGKDASGASEEMATSAGGNAAGKDEAAQAAEAVEAAQVESQEADEAAQRLYEFARSLTSDYFAALRSIFCRPLQRPTSVATSASADGDEEEPATSSSAIAADDLVLDDYDDLLAALRLFASGLEKFPVRLPAPLLSKLRLPDRVAEVIEGAIRAHCDRAFGRLRFATARHIRDTHDRLFAAEGEGDDQGGACGRGDSPALAMSAQFAVSAMDTLLSEVGVATRGTMPLLRAGLELLPDLAAVLCRAVRGQLHAFLQWLPLTLASFALPTREREGEASIDNFVEAEAAASFEATGDALATADDAGSGDLAALRAVLQLRQLRITPLFLFVLARQCKALADKGVMKAMGVLQQATREVLVGVDVAGTDVTDAAEDAQELARLVNATRESAEVLLLRFIALHSDKISQMLRKSVETPNWLKHKEPRDVRLVIGLVLEEVASVTKQVTKTLGDEPLSGSRRTSVAEGAHGRHAHVPRRAGVSLDIDRIFAKKVQLFANLDFTREAIVSSVFKLALKTFLECLRLCTLGRNGYQQIQVDVYFLRIMLPHFISDTAVLDQMLDDILISAAERCLEPTPLEQSVVVSIGNAKKAKLQIV